MAVISTLALHGIAKLEAELLEALDLREVTLVGIDSGLFQVKAGEYPERIARLVIAPCETFENFPPGLPGRTLTLVAKVPGGLNALVQPLRLRTLGRLPITFSAGGSPKLRPTRSVSNCARRS